MRCLPWNRSMEPISKTSAGQMNSTFWRGEHRLKYSAATMLGHFGVASPAELPFGTRLGFPGVNSPNLLNLNYKAGLLMIESWRIAIEHNRCALNAFLMLHLSGHYRIAHLRCSNRSVSEFTTEPTRPQKTCQNGITWPFFKPTNRPSRLGAPPTTCSCLKLWPSYRFCECQRGFRLAIHPCKPHRFLHF